MEITVEYIDENVLGHANWVKFTSPRADDDLVYCDAHVPRECVHDERGEVRRKETLDVRCRL